MMDGMGGMGWMMLFWALLGIALIVLVVLGIAWLVRTLIDRGTDSRPAQLSDPGEDELRRQYASGVIDHEEYQRRLSHLRHD